MNRFLATVAAAVLLGAGLTASADPSARAAASSDGCPYTGCISTTTVASGPSKIDRRQRADVAFKVIATGNVKPTGFVKVWVVQKTNDRKYGRSYIVDYRGGRGSIPGDRVTRVGRYDVRTKFIPDADGPFTGSADAYDLRVKRAKGR